MRRALLCDPALCRLALPRGAAAQRRAWSLAGVLSRERSTAGPEFPRWRNVPAVLSIQASFGSMYAWSVFNNPLCRELGVAAPSASDWVMTQTVPVFSAMAVCFGITCVVTGPWQERVGPRHTCAVGAVCWGSGLAVAALGTAMHSLPMLFCGYGVLGGIGFGLGSVPATVNLIRWFPGRKGLVTGISVSGLGAGAVVAAPLNEALLRHFYSPPRQAGVSAAEVLTEGGKRVALCGDSGLQEVVIAGPDAASLPGGVQEGVVYIVGTGDTGVAATFSVLSCLYTALILGGAFAQRVPNEAAEQALARGHRTAPTGTSSAGALYVPAAVAVRTPQAAYLFSCTVGNAFAGLTILSAAKSIVSESFGAAAPTLVTPTFAAGYVMVLAAANVAGRLFWGGVSDAIGRRNIFLFFGAAGVPTCIALPILAATAAAAPTPAAAVAPIYGFCAGSALLVSFYGASTALLQAFVADIFGLRQATTIIGRLYVTGWATAALLGPTTLCQLRARSYEAAAHDVAARCDPADFQKAFGGEIADLPSLLDSQIVTLPALLRIAPPGTPDPTPALYDSSMHLMATALFLAFVSAYLIRPVEKGLWVKGAPAARSGPPPKH